MDSISYARLGLNDGKHCLDKMKDYYLLKIHFWSISNWSKIKSEDRELISDISNYLNSSSDEYDYLDDRIFRIAQCWEMMAKK